MVEWLGPDMQVTVEVPARLRRRWRGGVAARPPAHTQLQREAKVQLRIKEEQLLPSLYRSWHD
jgi:hypothetical protein